MPLAAPTPLAAGMLVAVVGLTQSALFAYLPVMVSLTGLSPGALAAATGAGLAVSIAAAPLMGWACDRAGPRRLLLGLVGGLLLSQAATAGVIGAAAGGALTGAACLWLLVACRLVHGGAVSGIVPAMQAWLCGRTMDAERLRGLAALSAGLSAGRLLGPVVVMAGLMMGMVGPLWLLAALTAGAALLPLAWAPPAAAAAPPRTPTVWPPAPLLAVAALLNASFGAVHFTFGLLLQARLGVTSVAASVQVGVVTSVAGLLMLAVQVWLVPRLSRRRRLGLGSGLALVAAGCALLLVPAGLAGLGLGLAAIAVGMALAVPVYTLAITEHAAAGRQGRTAGILAAVHTSAYAVGAMLGGAALAHGPALPALGGAIMATTLLMTLPVLAVRRPAAPVAV